MAAMALRKGMVVRFERAVQEAGGGRKRTVAGVRGNTVTLTTARAHAGETWTVKRSVLPAFEVVREGVETNPRKRAAARKAFVREVIGRKSATRVNGRKTCAGVTAAGESCKSVITLEHGFCRAHAEQA